MPVSVKTPAETYKDLTPNKSALLRAGAGLAPEAAPAAQLPGGGELANLNDILGVLPPTALVSTSRYDWEGECTLMRALLLDRNGNAMHQNMVLANISKAARADQTGLTRQAARS